MASQREDLEEDRMSGADMNAFLRTDLGGRFMRRLHKAYVQAIKGALNESPTYKESVKQLEEMAAWVNTTLDLSKIAQERLDRLGRQENTESPHEEDDWG